jgi:hypothetical protein
VEDEVAHHTYLLEIRILVLLQNHFRAKIQITHAARKTIQLTVVSIHLAQAVITLNFRRGSSYQEDEMVLLPISWTSLCTRHLCTFTRWVIKKKLLRADIRAQPNLRISQYFKTAQNMNPIIMCPEFRMEIQYL